MLQKQGPGSVGMKHTSVTATFPHLFWQFNPYSLYFDLILYNITFIVTCSSSALLSMYLIVYYYTPYCIMSMQRSKITVVIGDMYNVYVYIT